MNPDPCYGERKRNERKKYRRSTSKLRKKPTFYEGGRTSPVQVPIEKLEKTKGVPMARDGGRRRKTIWSV